MMSQTAKPKPSFLKSPAIPLVIIVACFAIALLAQAGYIDLPKVGKQVKYLLEPPDDSPETGVIGLSDGKVGNPYSDDSLNQIPGQMRAKGVCLSSCKFSIPNDDMILPPGLKFNSASLSITGVPIQEGTWTFELCWEDAEYEGCADTEFSITIKPKKEPSPYRGECPTKPNPPCHSVQENGEIPVQAEGMLTYDYCKCPEGTHPEGVDNISPGAPYIICMCD